MWTNLVWALIYFAIGWLLSDACETDDDVSKMVIFISWPLIIGLFLIVAVVLLIVALIYAVVKLLYNL